MSKIPFLKEVYGVIVVAWAVISIVVEIPFARMIDSVIILLALVILDSVRSNLGLRGNLANWAIPAIGITSGTIASLSSSRMFGGHSFEDLLLVCFFAPLIISLLVVPIAYVYYRRSDHETQKGPLYDVLRYFEYERATYSRSNLYFTFTASIWLYSFFVAHLTLIVLQLGGILFMIGIFWTMYSVLCKRSVTVFNLNKSIKDFSSYIGVQLLLWRKGIDSFLTSLYLSCNLVPFVILLLVYDMRTWREGLTIGVLVSYTIFYNLQFVRRRLTRRSNDLHLGKIPFGDVYLFSTCMVMFNLSLGYLLSNRFIESHLRSLTPFTIESWFDEVLPYLMIALASAVTSLVISLATYRSPASNKRDHDGWRIALCHVVSLSFMYVWGYDSFLASIKLGFFWGGITILSGNMISAILFVALYFWIPKWYISLERAHRPL